MHALLVSGGTPLHGQITASGAKNAALPLLMATLLAPGEHTLHGVPDLADVATTLQLLQALGCAVEVDRAAAGMGLAVRVDSSPVAHGTPPAALVRRMRASVLALGPLLARHGTATLAMPGGCAIGQRPIDQHLRGLEALGCRFSVEAGRVRGERAALQGATVVLPMPTVTGTENILMAATLARGTTTIHGAAQEPEVVDLARFLTSLGARISGAGTSVLTVEGVPSLRPAPRPHVVVPDRIEAGTYLLAGAATGGDVTVRGIRPAHLAPALSALRAAGARLWVGPDSVRVRASATLRGVSIHTAPHPGFPTDLQPQWMTLLCCARGRATITETVFENRLRHAVALQRMGARIEVEGRVARVWGGGGLVGAPVQATDLRAGAALVLAGLAAHGITEIRGLHHLDRGYERLEEKLGALGARIARVAVSSSAPMATAARAAG